MTPAPPKGSKPETVKTTGSDELVGIGSFYTEAACIVPTDPLRAVSPLRAMVVADRETGHIATLNSRKDQTGWCRKCGMRFQGQAERGFSLSEIRCSASEEVPSFPEQFSGLDPCVGDGTAFTTVLESSNAVWDRDRCYLYPNQIRLRGAGGNSSDVCNVVAFFQGWERVDVQDDTG